MNSYAPDPCPAFAELHCLSNFSFQRGASHPEELVARALELGYSALAITDECSLAGIVRAHQALREAKAGHGFQLIIGSELKLADGPHIVLLAPDREAYAALSRLVTRGRRAAIKGTYRLARADLHDVGRCLALLVPPEGEVDRLALATDLRWLAAHFPDACWLAVQLFQGPDDDTRLAALLAAADAAGVPAVASNGALMHAASRRALADVLATTRLGVSLAEAGMALAPNGERHLHARDELARRYPAALLQRTLEVARRCSFTLDELRYEYPDGLVPHGSTPADWLRRLVENGLAERKAARRSADSEWPPAEMRARIEYELALIGEMGYEPYFLTVHDIVCHAKSRGILCQGRGSAANSVVCWALGITEVDPERSTLLFERFISRERNEPPDIDVDFEHERREEVIQYIYRHYGRERAALVATVIRYRTRGALRDVGRALGFERHHIDMLSRDHCWFDGRHLDPERVREAGFDPDSAQMQLLSVLVTELIGFPRHLSQHVGGFVIARGRLDELVPIENAAMPERTVIQWDKDDLDAVGLLKIDVLALGMLSMLRRALGLVSEWRGWSLTLADISREVPAVYEMLSRADSVGVFQVESRAQMTMLPRLKPRCFYDLVIEVAIVRPGPIQGGMVHPYLAARERAARALPIDYPECDGVDAGRAVRTVLERTLGVPIFQEQVMQLAIAAAGFTPGEADRLRRSMGAWRRPGELEQYRAKLSAGMLQKGFSAAFAERVCRQIEGFGSYGFPESHAASFALLVYFSAWFKCFEPAAFLCALLNSQPMGFYAPAQLIRDAEHHGVEVRAPDVCRSEWESTLEATTAQPGPTVHGFAQHADPAVRLGLDRIKGLSAACAERIVTARRHAPFASVAELATRAGLEAADLRRLAAAGALNGLSGHRREAVWQAAVDVPRTGLLAGQTVTDDGPAMPAAPEAREIVADYAALGFTLRRHPLALLRETLGRLRFEPAERISRAEDRQVARAAGIVTCRQRPGSAKGTLFITLEDETGLVNIIVSATLFERQRRILLGARLLGVYGQIRREGPVVHLVAGRVVDHSALLGELATSSRDFH